MICGHKSYLRSIVRSPFDMQTSDNVIIQQQELAEIIPLRQQLLRPGRPAASCYFTGDDGSQPSHHFGALVDDQLVAIASIYATHYPLDDTLPGWQLRGVATLAQYRGRGLASALVREAVAFAAMQGASLVWCNVRSKAQGMYSRQGFYAVGDEFMIADIGWHRLMRCDLS